MSDEGTTSLADAFAGAMEEVGLGEPAEAEVPLPGAEAESDSTGEQAPSEVVGKPDNGDEDEDEALSLDGLEELFTPEEGEAGIDPTSDAFLDSTVSVKTPEGIKQVTVREARDGYLRQSDYTKKTQEAAELRRGAIEAVDFYDTFKKDPVEFARSMAVRAQLIEEGQQPVGDIGVAFKTPAEIDAEVEAKVAERLASDPSAQAASLASAREAVAAEFARIEIAQGVTLNASQREAVIRQANLLETTRLDLVFGTMVAELQSKRSRDLKKAAPSRPTGGAGPIDKGTAEAKPKSVAEAFKAAQAELSRA